jgi:glycosyltransferase involved in cell wall biosynthesis
MKIALVYDRVNKWGGAERLLLVLHQIWPQAPLYTAVYNSTTAPWAKEFKVIPSFLDRWPWAKTTHEYYPWLMPLAFESFEFKSFDLIISVTSEAAKGIITKPDCLHLCYCLTPTRYLWSGYQDYFEKSVSRIISQPLIAYLRKWDKIASQRPDDYLAISENVQARIKKYYQRDSTVVYPPIDTQKWRLVPGKPENFFLAVGRLVAYKKFDLLIKAFNYLGWPLKIVGVGREEVKLKRMASNNIEFLGQLTDAQLLVYYQKSRAVVFPPEEDFGLVPLEAQSCGRPVIAYRAGGAQETIVEGKTGLFFHPQTVEALIRTLKSFRRKEFKPTVCRKNAQEFDVKIFERKIKQLVEERWLNFQNLKKT